MFKIPELSVNKHPCPVAKQPDTLTGLLLRSDNKDVNQAINPLSLTAVKFGVLKSTDGAQWTNCELLLLL